MLGQNAEYICNLILNGISYKLVSFMELSNLNHPEDFGQAKFLHGSGSLKFVTGASKEGTFDIIFMGEDANFINTFSNLAKKENFTNYTLDVQFTKIVDGSYQLYKNCLVKKIISVPIGEGEESLKGTINISFLDREIKE